MDNNYQQGGFDPMTGQPLGQQAAPQMPQGGFDPMTGQPLGQQAAPQMPQGGFDPMTGQPLGQRMAPMGGPQPQKKSKKGLIIGLSVGGVLLLAGIAVLVLFLTGVIGGGGMDKVAGYYEIQTIEMGGEKVNVKELAESFGVSTDELGMGMMLNEDGTGYLSMYGETMSLTWDEKTILIDGETANYNLSGKQLTIEVPGEGKMVFERSDKAPGEVQADPEPDPDPAPAPMPGGDVDTTEISGNYLLIMVGDDFVGEYDGYVYLWNDGTANVYYKNETYTDCPITYTNNVISINLPDDTWTGALMDGMMTVTTKTGESLIFGTEDSTIYETWASLNAGGGGDEPDVPVPVGGVAALINDTPYDIAMYWISPGSAENWNDPTGYTIKAGEVMNFDIADLEPETSMVYDIRLLIADSADQSDIAFYGPPMDAGYGFRVYQEGDSYVMQVIKENGAEELFYASSAQ